MTTQLKAKLLQHFVAKKKGNGGFTLIELLVVIIIIGILSAIALPSFLNQANKARQSEAKTYIGSMNRGQQAVYLETGGFAVPASASDTDVATAFAQLGLGINNKTESYGYSISASGSGVVNTAKPHVLKDDGTVDTSKKPAVKGYLGGVKVGSVVANGEATTLAILCEALLSPIAGGDAAATITNVETMDAATPGAPTCKKEAYKTIK